MPSSQINFEATVCGRLPLNQTNLIQPHGVLLLISKTDYSILQVSENISSLLIAEPAAIINQPLESFIDEVSYKEFRNKITGLITGKIALDLHFKNVNESTCLASVLVSEAYCLIEIELEEFISKKENPFVDVFQNLKRITALINSCVTLQEVCAASAKEIKSYSGFDKVMIYSFDKDWNGTVIAEEKEEGMDSYMGLKFPSSDIPKPARDMYLKNPYRLIPNRDYAPVRLYPSLNPATNTFTNLSETDLRSVAGVHLEYLKNMKVMASMSIRIISNGKLWGLIACHHRIAKYLSLEQRSVFEWLSDVISSRITAINNNASVVLKSHLNEKLTSIVERLYRHDEMISIWEEEKDAMLDYLHADGLAFCWNNMVETTGVTPVKYDVETILYWLQGKAENNVYHEPSLPLAFDEANSFASQSCGLLALPVQASKGSYLLAFRQEAIRKVAWGGNPNEAVLFEKNSSVYHPRNSFNQWQEIVRNTSEPWLEEEISAAENLRRILVEFTLNKLYQ